MWWAPDGAHLAYFKFNETAVPEFLMPIYDGSAYPEIDNLAYPKVFNIIDVRVAVVRSHPDLNSPDLQIPK